ncbi:MAG: methyltransferase domain-containing protein [Anaerolineales bacterium]
MRPALNFPSRLLRFFFFLLYHPLAWSYDLVAWIVSLGQWKAWLYTALPELTGPRILELGHGPGHLQLVLRERGFMAFGLDRSKQMGCLAARRLASAAHPGGLVRAAAEHIPFKSGNFDQVVATFPSEFILKPETLAEVRRVVQPTGSLVVLPFAWIRKKSFFGGIAEWLYRITGQSPQWDGSFSEHIKLSGFDVKEKRIQLTGSEVIILLATTV